VVMRVLILCTGNSARSQMAEGLLRHDAGEPFEVRSAGARPSQVRAEAIAAMRDVGIDIPGQRSICTPLRMRLPNAPAAMMHSPTRFCSDF
jgi:arsenate reductase (thioredoxin)